MKKWKIISILVLISSLFAGKWYLFDYKVSSGRRVGNLTKISLKGKIIKTWEGILDEGSGDKLTTLFSVRNDTVGKELYAYEGRQVAIFYEEHILNWPYDTKYNVISWKPVGEKSTAVSEKEPEKEPVKEQEEEFDNNDSSQKLYQRHLFCTLIGALYANPELYGQVKKHLEQNNLYLFNQISACNE